MYICIYTYVWGGGCHYIGPGSVVGVHIPQRSTGIELQWSRDWIPTLELHLPNDVASQKATTSLRTCACGSQQFAGAVQWKAAHDNRTFRCVPGRVATPVGFLLGNCSSYRALQAHAGLYRSWGLGKQSFGDLVALRSCDLRPRDRGRRLAVFGLLELVH